MKNVLSSLVSRTTVGLPHLGHVRFSGGGDGRGGAHAGVDISVAQSMQIRLSGIAARRGCGIGLPQLSQGVISAWSIRSCCRSSNRRTLRSPHLLHLSSPNSSETALSVGSLPSASSTNEPSNSAVCPHWLQTTESLENTCMLQFRAERRRNNTGRWWAYRPYFSSRPSTDLFRPAFAGPWELCQVRDGIVQQGSRFGDC